MKYLHSLLAFLLLPTSALAHAGDHSQATLNHFSASLFHLFPAVAIIGVVSYFIAKKIYSKK